MSYNQLSKSYCDKYVYTFEGYWHDITGTWNNTPSIRHINKCSVERSIEDGVGRVINDCQYNCNENTKEKKKR